MCGQLRRGLDLDKVVFEGCLRRLLRGLEADKHLLKDVCDGYYADRLSVSLFAMKYYTKSWYTMTANMQGLKRHTLAR